MDPLCNDVHRHILSLCEYPTQLFYSLYLNRYLHFGIDIDKINENYEELLDVDLPLLIYLIENIKEGNHVKSLMVALTKSLTCGRRYRKLMKSINYQPDERDMEACSRWHNLELFRYLHLKHKLHYTNNKYSTKDDKVKLELTCAKCIRRYDKYLTGGWRPPRHPLNGLPGKRGKDGVDGYREYKCSCHECGVRPIKQYRWQTHISRSHQISEEEISRSRDLFIQLAFFGAIIIIVSCSFINEYINKT